MQIERTTFSRRDLIIALSAAGFATLASNLIVPRFSAFGTPSSEKQAEADAVRNQLAGYQLDLIEASNNYYEATSAVEAAHASMEEQQAKIKEANEQIDGLQGRLANRARDMYKSGGITAIDMLLGASTFREFSNNMEFLQIMNKEDAQLIYDSKELRRQLKEAEQRYAEEEKIAKEKQAEAERIQAETEAKIATATELMNSLDAEAKELLRQEQQAVVNSYVDNYVDQDIDYGYSGPPIPEHGSVVSYAESRLGCPYVWGATGPGTFDCSGLTQWCYAQIGIAITRTTETQLNAASQVTSVAEARPGDVLYTYGHVGIATEYGGGTYIHAPQPGEVVCYSNWAQFSCALRFM